MNKIYISGRITGIETEAPLLFAEACIEMRELGFDTVNPMDLEHNHDKSWNSYMRNDIKALMECDAIYMISNWVHSKGAEIERRIAMDLGMKVIYESQSGSPE